MFGRTVFGDAAHASDPASSKPISAPASDFIPVPRQGSQTPMINQVIPQVIGVPRGPSGIKPVTAVSPLTSPISERIPQVIGIPANNFSPDPTSMPPQARAQYGAWVAQHRGIFHQPPMVGQNRYQPWHPFGPPTLGYAGLGSPDGLAGLRGFR